SQLETDSKPERAAVEHPGTAEPVAQLSLFEAEDEIKRQLLELDLLAMNPIEAMQALYALQQSAKKG
ncbi:MAG: hypothetical protein ACK411_14945, partial [Exiguobacterium mexicanum]